MTRLTTKIHILNFSLWYGNKQALRDISMEIYANHVTALIGPSGCGKSTLLRSINRMNDLIENVRVSGKILLDGKNVYDPDVDVVTLRKRVGLVFQKPNPFPKSIFENVVFGPRLNGIRDKERLHHIAEESLKKAALWSEVKDILHQSALSLSGGQQQRLCIARAIAVNPEVLLMDEPTSALDPISTAKIEELIESLREDYTIVIVTHNMQQAARISQYTAFLYLGELIEYSKTTKLFTNPDRQETEAYVTGRFG